VRPKNRRRILALLAQRINAENARELFGAVRKYCKRKGIPATNQDIRDLISEAFQLRVAQEIQKTREQSVNRDQLLNDKIDSYHPDP